MSAWNELERAKTSAPSDWAENHNWYLNHSGVEFIADGSTVWLVLNGQPCYVGESNEASAVAERLNEFLPYLSETTFKGVDEFGSINDVHPNKAKYLAPICLGFVPITAYLLSLFIVNPTPVANAIAPLSPEKTTPCQANSKGLQ